MKKIIIRITIIGLLLGVLGGLAGVFTLVYFSMSLPKISSLADYNPPIPSKIYAKDGTILAEIGKQKRDIVRFEEIPSRIVNAFLSAEDDNFYEHTGVDYLGLARALVVNLKAGRIVQGGSTITQQVAKSLLLSRERSISRKIKDFLLAQKIEQKFSKQDILFLYLNQVYLGGGYYGIREAFRGYFGKELEEATIAESAMIAGLLVAPGRYSPYIQPAAAKKRQRYVLSRMRDTGKISLEEYQEAIDEKIQYQMREFKSFKAGYFTDWVRQRVISLVGEEEFLTGGYEVTTTLNWKLQQVAEKEVWDGVKAIDKRQGFKGPIGTFEDHDQRILSEQEFRTKLYKDKSEYFTLSEENEKEFQYIFDEELFVSVVENQNKWLEQRNLAKYLPGNIEEDPTLALLEEEKIYEATVLKVDDNLELIYVSIGGVIGLIPQEHFRWARERLITEERQYRAPIRKPSQILKPLDRIQVSIINKHTNITKVGDKDVIKKIKDKELLKALKEEKYLLCLLDQEPDAQGALISISPKTGEIVSFVGGSDFSKSQFNRAIQSKRQPGSSFKPILFAAALEHGYRPSTIIIDSPEALGGGENTINWKPRNYDGKFKGPVTFRNSLEQSRNVPTIKIADAVGVSSILDFTDRIGFNAKLDPDLSLALGSFGVTLLDIVSTYAIFPGGGRKIRPISVLEIKDKDGNTFLLDEHKENDESEKNGDDEEVANSFEESSRDGGNFEEAIENPFHVTLNSEQVYDERLAYIMTNLLKGVVHYGTGKGTKNVSPFLGGKTGTTNSYVDAWFLGFSSNLATGVWTGFDDNETLGWGETGAKSALPIWKNFMQAGIDLLGESDFIAPPGIVNVMINKETGRPEDVQEGVGFMESFVEGMEPGTTDPMAEKNQDSGTIQSGIFSEDDYYDNQ